MGILNVTPDSFSDGGRDGSVEESVARAERLTEEGATIIDVGGESTRPGATPVSLDVELKRVIPVVQFLVSRHPRLPLSVDTTKAEVARVALEEGAALINDVSALSDPWMAPVLRDHDAPVVVMHRQGDPRIMQVNPAYQDVIREIKLFFEERLAFAATQGLQADRILLDPGIGFGKTTDHNLEILRRLPDFASLGRPLVLGLSRKSFLGRLLGGESTPLSPSERLEASLAAALWAAAQGTQILRVHDVRATARALTVWRNLAS
jgi:dihydropteroate synthase